MFLTFVSGIILGFVIGILSDDLLEIFDYLKKKFRDKKVKFRSMNKL